MRENKFLTIREVSEELGITEQEVIDLAEKGEIPAYKIGGIYLRFKPEQVKQAKKIVTRTVQEELKASFGERVKDFIYFNDFYILSTLIIVLMLIIIMRI